jgi:hypothetical protein
MNRIIHHMNHIAVASAVGLAAVVTLGVGSPVAATATSALFVGGGGIAEVDSTGAVIVEGPALVQDKQLRDMLDATIHATMAPTDGPLPAVGECTPASATFVIDGERDADMTLTSDGTVCRVQNSYFPAYVTVEFDGLHEVVEAKRPQLRGVTGSLSITVTPGGFTSLHADSFVPSP